MMPSKDGCTVGDISDPGSIRLRDIKLLLQPVRCDDGRRITFGSGVPFITDLGAQACRTHQAMYPVRTTAFTDRSQVRVDLAVTVHTAALQPELLDQPHQSPVVLGPCR